MPKPIKQILFVLSNMSANICIVKKIFFLEIVE